ncbi:hypothetical protein KAR91_35840 [Candidatus Pacearchaeota archaeon]|nr:hypothetical protein [Candidatus Pacearchaeota archaeon]
MEDVIEIDGVKYKKIPLDDNLPYVIVRTYSAGVHAGFLKSRDGKECELLEARRIWKWAGAASLSQLAVDGTSDPNNCKIPCPVESITLTEGIEFILCTDKAMKSISQVSVWKN